MEEEGSRKESDRSEGTIARIRQLQTEAVTGPSNKACIRQTSSVSGLFSELNRASSDQNATKKG